MIVLSMLALAAIVPPAAPAPQQSYFPSYFATRSVACGDAAGNKELILNPVELEWYPRQLRAAKEPSLYRASLDGSHVTTLRFTWLRSFHHPIMIRIEEVDGPAPLLIAKQLSGAGGYAPGEIAKRVERRLSTAEAGRLRTALTRGGVFSLSPTACDGGADGAEWILEQVDRHGYHFIKRWSPRGGPVRALGLLLVSLTGWNANPIY